MRVRVLSLFLLLGLVGLPMFALASKTDHKKGAHKKHTQVKHMPWEEDHWSVFDYALSPEARKGLREKMGPSWFDKDSSYRLAHVFMTVIVLLIIFFLVGRASPMLNDPEKALIPDKKLTAYNFLELMMEAVIGMMTTIMSEKQARKSLPLIGTLALFIFFGNLLAVIPGLLPATDNFNTTFACGVVVFFMYHYWGIQEHGVGAYMKHFLGPITAWYGLPLMILMFGIEMISHIVRPVSLGIRLMGNMFGDHAVLGEFLNFHIPLIPIPVMLLGLLVVVVQTLVFCLLSMVYIGMATAHTEH